VLLLQGLDEASHGTLIDATWPIADAICTNAESLGAFTEDDNNAGLLVQVWAHVDRDILLGGISDSEWKEHLLQPEIAQARGDDLVDCLCRGGLSQYVIGAR